MSQLLKQSFPAKSLNLPIWKISPSALQVMQKLNQAGFDAYLVGGALRDMLLGLTPKDFDVATNATPEQIKTLFKRQARIIGRRFQIVHVRFGRDIIEVTTFRGNHDAENVSPKSNQSSAASKEGILLRDNVFGSIEEDAMRRDFTCNALYYSDKNETLYDFCGSIDDINSKTLRLIGEPDLRYNEDPVRMLRAVRFAAKLKFTIEEQTAAAIRPNASLLASIPAARLFDESLKLFCQGYSQSTFELMLDYQLAPFLVQDLDDYIASKAYQKLFQLALQNTDRRIRQGKTITPAFLWAVLLWPKLKARMQQVQQSDKLPPAPALQEAAQQVIREQNQLTAIPKRFSITMKDIWALQLQLPKTQGKRAERTLSHPKFRAAYDFLLLREESKESDTELGPWWTSFQQSNAQLMQDSRSTRRHHEDTSDTSHSKRRPRRRKPAANKANSHPSKR